MRTIEYSHIGETLYYEKLENGLDVFLLPKMDFNKAYATFTTKYGSIDNHFVPIGQEELKKVPDGIAHFLEHKMFESETGDVFHEFSKNGASANAYTSFARTAYLFSATSNVKKNLETLIDFVQDPYFTDENVEKEKGIIEQEIKMYDDEPDWQLYHGLIANLYENVPVNIDIAGTVDSIYQITKEDLFACYNTFYHPANMLLFVVGNFDLNEIYSLIKENQSSKTFPKMDAVVRKNVLESDQPFKLYDEKQMDITIPKCLIGYKLKQSSIRKEDQQKRELAIKIALDMMFSKSGEIYSELIDQQLINDTFGFEYSEEASYGFGVIGGDTPDPEKFVTVFKELMSDVELDEESFTRTKKRKLGGFLSALNSLEYIANQFTRYEFNQMKLFETNSIIEDLTYEEFKEITGNFFDENQLSAYVLKPKK